MTLESTMRHWGFLLLGLGACANATSDEAPLTPDRHEVVVASERNIDSAEPRLSEDQACQAIVGTYQEHGLELGFTPADEAKSPRRST
jgi:hypothetical protein